MYYVIIDCGTTNSRAYIVDGKGTVYGTAKKTVGVKDTSVTGSKNTLRSGLKEIVEKAVKTSGIELGEIEAVLSSGMITSEIGLCELPHMDAPGGEDELAASMAEVKDTGIIEGIPVYFVRGIRNPVPDDGKDPTAIVGRLDFMRGEETQMMGLMEKPGFQLPAMAVVLSSHTKFIPIDQEGMILGSLSTMSGQLFESVTQGTFLHKSVIQGDSSEAWPEDYFDEKIVRDAIYWNKKVGLARTLMFPRFLDVLLDTKWYERLLFLDALVAAEDMLSVNQLDMLSDKKITDYYLIGQKERCRLYEFIIHETMPEIHITTVSDSEEIDGYSIKGMLRIAKKAGIVK
ncbi:hypothetical protein B5E77_08785 [Lachnoclostridium sp. An131]|uniref:2-dehydro-3-deoxygalactonokinase n=1 Tax=Lachnoclostridium sp. An131 TaxID=1965555 RepID=UPI000B394F7B|nr:2-dehydro-3-deoxygalactonokinase [Lachnoclostridium sp. An131]OUQ26579.1 hypothetical protein B5E77_08785 [Lachnoclostridium sp. An131]